MSERDCEKNTEKMGRTTILSKEQAMIREDDTQCPSKICKQQEEQAKNISENGKKGRAKTRQNSISNEYNYVLITYIPVRIIQQVENNNTRQCRYLLFHLPFVLMLCDTLQMHLQAPQTILFEILFDEIKRLHELNSKPPRQLPPEEVMSVIASALNFQKVPKGYFLKQLAKFMEKYSAKLSTFLPYYDGLFRLVLRRETYIGKQSNIEQLNQILSSTIAEIRSKYHNFDLQ